MDKLLLILLAILLRASGFELIAIYYKIALCFCNHDKTNSAKVIQSHPCIFYRSNNIQHEIAEGMVIQNYFSPAYLEMVIHQDIFRPVIWSYITDE